MEDDREERRTRSHKRYGKRRRKGGGWAWRILPVIQTILTVIIAWQIYTLNMLPMKFLAAGIGALVVLALIPWLLTSLRSQGSKVTGTVISVLVILVLGLGNYYLFKTYNTLQGITGARTIVQTDEVVFVVLKDSELQSLTDLSGKNLGIQEQLDRDNTDKALAELGEKISPGVVTAEYSNMGDMVQDLYDEKVDAILFNESYRSMITDEFEDFDTDTRILETYTYETKIEVKEEKTTEKNLAVEPFILYMSGIDTYGSVAAKSRSDVNIMAVVNPKTKQILLVTTPRDYYVALPFGDDCMDKLTHAGIYGIDCSIETLENLYDITIDHYFRMNFTGFIDIVDALGGVDVYSSQNFVTEAGGYSFSKGYNTVNGEQALGFVRERHSFTNGDFQRQRNQLEMIKAIVKKAASPSILTSYTSVLSSLENSFTMDLSTDDIGELVKMQLSDGADWNIQSFGVSGEGTRRTTYSMGSRSLYVCLQDENSINRAKELMQMVIDGEIIDESMMEEGAQE